MVRIQGAAKKRLEEVRPLGFNLSATAVLRMLANYSICGLVLHDGVTLEAIDILDKVMQHVCKMVSLGELREVLARRHLV